jgi:hypothetical protein
MNAALTAYNTDFAPNKQQATSNKQQATSNKQQATSNKQQATSNYGPVLVLVNPLTA